MQFQTILVPTDFSDDAKAALEVAIDFAKTVKASKLQIFHAYHLEIPPSYVNFGTSFLNIQDILDPIRESADSSIDALVKEVTAKGVNASGRVVMENPGQAILDEADRLPADLIVMGTRGMTGIKHVLFGSTAERVVRMAHCPVLTVKARG